ncbi:hypothetical protein VPHK373_0052 [Vibrio phage K373]
MSKVKQVEFGGVTVNISHALAKDQKKLYYMVFPFVDRLYKEVDDVPVIGVKELANVLGFIGAETMEKIERLALSRSFVHGSDGTKPVTESDFAGEIDAYHSLICEAIEWNLLRFFMRLGEERAERISKLPPKKAAQ